MKTERRRLWHLAFALTGLVAVAGCSGSASSSPPVDGAAAVGSTTVSTESKPATPARYVAKTDEELRKTLTPEQYHVTQQKGTERAFTGEYWDTITPGTYLCRVCDQPLFISDTKFEAGCGWPSFYEALDKSTENHVDKTAGMIRTEVVCSRCGAHLGHVFNDGPRPTGLRYCMNSASIKLEPSDAKDKQKEAEKKGDAK